MKPLALILAPLVTPLFAMLHAATPVDATSPFTGPSVYTDRPEDPHAIYFSPEAFPVVGDGMADDAEALQAAIDAAAAKDHAGVVFIPEGTYRLGKTVYVWSGIRLVGYGSSRPVLLLGEGTPGFQKGDEQVMLFFSGDRQLPESREPRDGTPGTFYSALTNINFQIREGNPAAVAVRFRVAQHSFVSHAEFDLGSARAGLADIGNEVEDLHFYGGEYGITTGRSAPGWPILVIDCSFDGQSIAAIRSREAGLTVVRPRFRNTPTAVDLNPDYPDQLSVVDGMLELVSGPAFTVGGEYNARTQVHLENLICREVPTLVRLLESGRKVTMEEPVYRVESWSHGLHLNGSSRDRGIKTSSRLSALASLPDPVESDIPPLPGMDTWTNVHDLGIVGDGETDVTAKLQDAINSHATLYFPIGVYRISDTLNLHPDTSLVGLNPGSTALYLPPDSPGFQNPGQMKPLVVTPPGGTNILDGIGVYAAPRNPSACAILWKAGPTSLMNDVRLHGGHGTYLPGDLHDNRGKDHRDQWDSQFPSLWVTDGGGGVFKNTWSPSPYARAGLKVSDTQTRGRLYAMSAEHHVSNEVILNNAANWEFYALQFEGEREESPRSLPLLIEGSSNLLFANTFFYRVVSSFVPFSDAIRVRDSENVRLRNVHVYSNSKVSFDNAVHLVDGGSLIRDPEFARLDIPTPAGTAANPGISTPLAKAGQAERLADGFLNISGIAVDPVGNPYFADPRRLRVYRWSVARQRLESVCELPERPEQLAFDASGNLLIIAYEGDGSVFAVDPDEPDSVPIRLEPQPSRARPASVPLLPVNRWTGTETFLSQATTPKPYHYVAPDGSVFIPAGEDFVSGATRWGTKLSDLLRAFAVAPAHTGKPFYITNEMNLRTWVFEVNDDGSLADPELFVNEGGEAVAVDSQGRVAIAAGQIRIFDSAGETLGRINVEQRPTSLAFGGPDGATLYITARSAFYRVRLGEGM